MKLIKLLLLAVLGSSVYLSYKHLNDNVVFKPRATTKNNRIEISLFNIHKR